MDYPIRSDNVYIPKTIFEDTSEQSVDADFALPDYCPDIQKILKCELSPRIESKNIVGDRIEIEGASVARIIYIDAIKNSVRCTEQSYPFTVNSNLKDTPQFAVIHTDIKVNYLNCRALSPRRLNIHGAFNLGIKITDKCELHPCTDIIGSDVQRRRMPVDYSYLRGIAQQQFTIAETLETGTAAPAVQSVIRTDIRAVTADCKPIANKIMYKGELRVKLMYLSDLDSGSVETMEHSVPFSQVIDINGAAENSLCAVRTEVMSAGVALKSEIGFDDPLPVLTAKICVTAFAYEERDTTVVTDCYSTLRNMETSRAAYTFPMLTATLRENVVEKTMVDFTDISISKVLDVWCERGTASVRGENDKLALCGKYNVCVLVCGADNNVVYTERAVEYTQNLSAVLPSGKLQSCVSAECLSTGFRICSDKRIEVRTELLVTGEVYSVTEVNAVCAAKADENSQHTRADDSSLVLYFAEEGEDVWDIARDYRTSVAGVRMENDLDDDVLTSRRMLMIPIV